MVPCARVKQDVLHGTLQMQGTRNPFIALFQSRQVSKTGKVTAFISRSTRGMRAVLQNAPHSLAFSMPLAPAGSSDACSERHTKELLELGQVQANPNSFAVELLTTADSYLKPQSIAYISKALLERSWCMPVQAYSQTCIGSALLAK